MTLLELMRALKSEGLIERATRIKAGDSEVELSAPVDTETKTMRVELPETVQHGIAASPEDIRRAEEAEALSALYGAGAAGFIPSGEMTDA